MTPACIFRRSRALVPIFATFLAATLPALASATPPDRLSLASADGIEWRIRPEAEVTSDAAVHKAGIPADGWVKGVVPGTVFGAYVAAGVEPDPNWADNAYRVDATKYNRNFWYRAEFAVPSLFGRERVWLNTDGVNRDAELFLNGRRLGLVQGIVQRGRFDVTRLLVPGAPNVLAILVHVPLAPVSNGASPTYGSSGGWDWMPAVPGLNMGIQDDVYLTTTGEVSVVDPWIQTEIVDTDLARLSVQVELRNTSNKAVSGVLSGVIEPGEISFSLPVEMPALSTKALVLDGNAFPQLSIRNPALWWPNGYGLPNLYRCRLSYAAGDVRSDSADFRFGIRKLAVDISTRAMRIIVNDVPIFARGGNWGMPEYMLRVSPAEYDTRIRLHQDMNFNMIRNWMGSTTDDAFYEACDRYGILVWDDFWLNSSGGVPRDINVFNANVVEKLKRLRNHPSIALWCGDNEGDPPPPLSDWMAASIKTFDGRHYHPNSHSVALSGSGPWHPIEPKDYFLKAAPGNWGGEEGWGMRSEIGVATFVNLESLRKFIPADKLWPRNDMWDKHFFGPSAVYAGPDSYEKAIATHYGPPKDIADFCRKAQLLNIENYKAMFEGWADRLWNDATGILIWMSQSAYPSLVWQTYDYYFDATGAYWGSKKACEPVHIQWNSGTNEVKVANTTLRDLTSLRAEARIFGLDGVEIESLRQSATLDAGRNSTSGAFVLSGVEGNLARGRAARASSFHVVPREPDKLVDGDLDTRWESNFAERPWFVIDLGTSRRFDEVILHWAGGRAQSYKLQVSSDERAWKDIAFRTAPPEGAERVLVPGSEGRFLRMYCIEKATSHGISVKEIEVRADSKRLPQTVHFVRLRLTDAKGSLVSENTYWRGAKERDYTGLDTLAPVTVQTKTSVTKRDNRQVIGLDITNPQNSPAAAFAIHLQVLDPKTGERILPVIATDNYFTLMRGEARHIDVEFEASDEVAARSRLVVTPYNASR